jgi:hypothetical protein
MSVEFDDDLGGGREEEGGAALPGDLRAVRPARAGDDEPEAKRPRSDQDIAAGLRLRPERSRVTRLSRRVLATLGGVAAVAVAAALMFALWPHGKRGRGTALYRKPGHAGRPEHTAARL